MNKLERERLNKIKESYWKVDSIVSNEDIRWLIQQYDKLQKWVDTIKELIRLT